MACVEEEKLNLRSEGTENGLDLKGSEQDPLRNKPLETFINTQHKRIPIKKVQREERILNQIRQWRRLNNETLKVIANKIDARVATYMHQNKDTISVRG